MIMTFQVESINISVHISDSSPVYTGYWINTKNPHYGLLSWFGKISLSTNSKPWATWVNATIAQWVLIPDKRGCQANFKGKKRRRQYVAVTVLGQNNNGARMAVERKRGGDGAEGRPGMSKTGRERERERGRARGRGVSGCQGPAVPVSDDGAVAGAPVTQLSSAGANASGGAAGVGPFITAPLPSRPRGKTLYLLLTA